MLKLKPLLNLSK